MRSAPDLVHQGMDVVKTVSRRLARRLGGQVPVDDLRGIGNLALLDVTQTWDPSRATFSSYATWRLKWAILDGLRRETHARITVGRVTAVMASERLADAEAEASSEGGNLPGPPPPRAEEEQALAELLAGHAAALAVGLLAAPPDPALVETPEEKVQRAELAHLIRGVVRELPDRERELIERHYFGGEPFDVIARDLGISKSWASRLHERAILAVKEAIGAQADAEP